MDRRKFAGTPAEVLAGLGLPTQVNVAVVGMDRIEPAADLSRERYKT